MLSRVERSKSLGIVLIVYIYIYIYHDVTLKSVISPFFFFSLWPGSAYRKEHLKM